MSLANLTVAIDAEREDARNARRQLAELNELIALWFFESDCAARDWLYETGRQYREKQARQQAVGTQPSWFSFEKIEYVGEVLMCPKVHSV